MMLRTPRAWAPSSSDSRAIRFRSRVVQWTRHSRSRSCWIPNATDRALIRTRAIAESETLTRSTPASRRSRAAAIVRSIRMLRGGSISTETTKRPAARSAGQARRRRRVVRSGDDGSTLDDGLHDRDDCSGDGWPARATERARPRWRRPHRSPRRIAAMCSGVVPQQPPTIRAPAASRRGVTASKYSALAA